MRASAKHIIFLHRLNAAHLNLKFSGGGTPCLIVHSRCRWRQTHNSLIFVFTIPLYPSPLPFFHFQIQFALPN